MTLEIFDNVTGIVFDDIYDGYLLVLDGEYDIIKLAIVNILAHPAFALTPKLKEMLRDNTPVVYLSRYYKTVNEIVNFMLANIDYIEVSDELRAMLKDILMNPSHSTFGNDMPDSMYIMYMISRAIANINTDGMPTRVQNIARFYVNQITHPRQNLYRTSREEREKIREMINKWKTI